jgi:hypothetical protein
MENQKELSEVGIIISAAEREKLVENDERGKLYLVESCSNVLIEFAEKLFHET